MRKPSYKQAEWIYRNLFGYEGFTADDVYDVLLSNITNPVDFVQEVKYLAVEYDEAMRRNNA